MITPFRRVILLSALTIGCLPMSARGDSWQGGYTGIDIGVMQPVQETFPDYVDTGGTMAPYVGYMFNDFIGIQAQVHFLGAGTEQDRTAPGQDGGATLWGALAGGPVVAVPITSRFSLSATFQPLFATSFADEALTDTSWGFSTGPAFNARITEHFGMGVFARYNRLYQRVHGDGDPKYVTAGVSLTYYFPDADLERPLPVPPPPAAPAQAVPPPPVVRRKVVPRAVYFDFDKSNIRPDAEDTLNEAIRIIKEHSYKVVVCEGHTDSRGTDEYNQALSLRRAGSVREYLIAGGIPASAITIEGFGESRPVATNDTDDGRQQNRRVELRVSE